MTTTDDQTNWDTSEIALIIANDEGLYNTCNRYARQCPSISALADMIESDMIDIIPTMEYCEVDIDEIDWHTIATEIMDDYMEAY